MAPVAPAAPGVGLMVLLQERKDAPPLQEDSLHEQP